MTLLRQLVYPPVAFALTLFWGTMVVVASLLRVRYRARGFYDWCQKWWGRQVLWVSGCPVSVRGGDRLAFDGPHIIASNHASFFDILAIAGYLPVPVRFVAKKELYRIPYFGAILRSLGHVRIDRQHLKEAFHAYEEAAAIIRERRLHVLVFVEGTRTRTGDLLPFKKGPFVLAIQCGAPVVPIHVSGTFGILPKRSLWIRPHPIVLSVGTPIPVDGMTYDDRAALADRAEAAVRAMRDEVEAAR